MKTKMIKNILILITLSYICFSFVLMELNPINWSDLTRFWFTLSPVIYLLVSGVLVVLLELKDEIKKEQE